MYIFRYIYIYPFAFHMFPTTLKGEGHSSDRSSNPFAELRFLVSGSVELIAFQPQSPGTWHSWTFIGLKIYGETLENSYQFVTVCQDIPQIQFFSLRYVEISMGIVCFFCCLAICLRYMYGIPSNITNKIGGCPKMEGYPLPIWL